MKTVKTWLEEEWKENSGHITKEAILTKSAHLVGSYLKYSDIEGKYMAVYSYWDHNVEDLNVVENDKWVGYELTLDHEKTEWLMRLYNCERVQLIVPQWVMKLEVSTERHAKNLFKKYLRSVK